jgi:8-oxo-dGTP diphosphatase
MMQRSECGPSASSSPIRNAALIVVDREGRVLLVRKRFALFFMQPGGKLDEGETLLETLACELDEGLGCALRKAEFLGVFSALAANEPPQVVEARSFMQRSRVT